MARNLTQLPTAVDVEEPQPNPRKLSYMARFGLDVYRQVGAVFAAFGIVALLGHWWHIGWRGWLQSVVQIWGLTVRPAMQWIFHVLITVPLGWLGVHFELPLWARDYLSIGLIVLLSTVREATRQGLLVQEIRRRPKGRRWHEIFIFTIGWLPLTLFLWPLTVSFEAAILLLMVLAYFVVASIEFLFLRSQPDGPETRVGRWRRGRQSGWRLAGAGLRVLSPVIYLGLLLAVNFWVMPHPS
jgi:hypothetical protein